MPKPRQTESRNVIIALENRPVTGSASRWISSQWVVADVREDFSDSGFPDAGEDHDAIDEIPANPAVQIWPAIEAQQRLTFAGLAVSLHHSEGEGYWLNLNSPQPCVFVMWRQESPTDVPTPWVATVSYNEAGRMLDAGEKVETAPMPPGFLEWVKAFTDAHYKPEPKKKIKRNDPFKDGAFLRGRQS